MGGVGQFTNAQCSLCASPLGSSLDSAICEARPASSFHVTRVSRPNHGRPNRLGRRIPALQAAQLKSRLP